MGGDRSGRYGFIEVCRVELRSEGEVWECEGWGDRVVWMGSLKWEGGVKE